MFLDPEGIARATRWEFERPGDRVDWVRVAAVVGEIAQEDLSAALVALADRAAQLPKVLQESGVEPEVQTRCLPRIDAVLRGLRGVP